MMARSPRRVAPPLALLAAALAGCHVVPGSSPGPEPLVALDAGRGRVDSAYPAGLGPTARAAVAALGELGVAPRDLSILLRETKPGRDGGVCMVEDPKSNAELLAGPLSRAALDDPQFEAHLPRPIPLDPARVAYRGTTADGRPVELIVATRKAEPGQAAGTALMARVGPDGDAAWNRDLLARVAAHLDQDQDGPKAAAPADSKSTQEVP